MSKNLQINEKIKKYLAKAINSEVESPNFLITVNKTLCSPDLYLVKAFVSILPEKFSGTALKLLRDKSLVLARALRQKAALVVVPKLEWRIDEDLKKIIALDETLDFIKEEDFD